MWKALERAFDDCLDARGRAVRTPTGASLDVEAKLRRDPDIVANWRQRFTDKLLLGVGPVDFAAVSKALAGEGQRTKPAPFGHALVELAKSRPEIVGMTADLGKYTDLHIFAQEYPDRYLPDGHGRAASDARGGRYGA